MGGERLIRGFGLGLGISVLSGILPATPPAIVWATTTTHTIQSVAFETPFPFSAPVPLGREGVGVLYPATASRGGQQFKITLLQLGPDVTGWTQLSDAELMNLLRFSFMGISAPPSGFKERTLMGRLLRGEVLLKKTSVRESYLEVYLLPLSTGETLVVTFEADTRMPLAQVEEIITTVGRTMRELPPDPKRQKKRKPGISGL